jgi:SAM-dependent methyltransferase
MSGTSAYIHGTEPSEQERLAALNRLTNQPFVSFLDVRPGLRVLEVGSGLGLLARDVSAVAAGVSVVGVEQSARQLAAATSSAAIHYVQGDAHRLPLADDSFDLVYARYVLEHVSEPRAMLREMCRVTRKGGRVAVCENDISLLRVDPPCPAFESVWESFQHHQARLGGDSQIGRRLFRLFREAGLMKIELSLQPDVHWFGSPQFAGWVRNIIGNVESAQDALIAEQLCTREQIQDAVSELEDLITNEQASSGFAWNRVVAVKA